MKNTKITSILIAASLSILVFAGCGSSTSKKTPMSPKTAINDTVKGLSSAMKTIYSDTLNGLVSAKTITQTQSDRVMEEVTKNVSKTKGSFNRLGKLVKNKVITQEQANKINQKIDKAMKKM